MNVKRLYDTENDKDWSESKIFLKYDIEHTIDPHNFVDELCE